MLRLEYIDNIGYYRIYNVENPNKTIAYESDYYEAKRKIEEYEKN